MRHHLNAHDGARNKSHNGGMTEGIVWLFSEGKRCAAAFHAVQLPEIYAQSGGDVATYRPPMRRTHTVDNKLVHPDDLPNHVNSEPAVLRPCYELFC